MGAHPNHVKEMIEICQTTTKKMFKNNDGKKKKTISQERNDLRKPVMELE